MNPEKSVPTVEIRIPISATEKHLRMTHYFLESLQQFGGPIGRSAKCVVSVSRDEPYRDLRKEYPWVSNYNVEFLWMDEDLFKKYNYHGTGFHRLKVKSEADIVILADADLLVANDFDQIILHAFTDQKLLGFIAHVSPFGIDSNYNDTPSKIWWKKIFDEAGLPLPSLNCVHTGWTLFYKDKRHSSCPYYYNYGFIISPRQYVEQVGQSFLSELEIIDSVLETEYKSQIANTLCCERHGISCGTLPINYNFPLSLPDDKIRALNPDPDGKNSADDVKIFHYLAGRFNREDFLTIESLENALQRKDLNDAETVFQRKLRFVHKKIMSRH